VNYQSLNVIVRAILALVILTSLALLFIAARPANHMLGTYLAVVNRPYPITGDWQIPAVFVTVSFPAVIRFPTEVDTSDKVCMVVRFERGPAPATFQDIEAVRQRDWDVDPQSAVLISPGNIVGGTSGATRLRIVAPLVAELTVTKLPYRVNWIGHKVIALYDKQWTGGILCYDFVAGAASTPLIPYTHSLGFKADNVNVTGQPLFLFRYKVAVKPDEPRETIDLREQDLESYLALIEQEAPFALQRYEVRP
jgi:hypothetical protein